MVAEDAGGGRLRHRALSDLLSGLSPPWRHLQHRVCAGLRSKKLHRLGTALGADQDHHDDRHRTDASAGDCHVLQGPGGSSRRDPGMSYELISLLMFGTMMVMLLTGQRVFGAIGF